MGIGQQVFFIVGIILLSAPAAVAESVDVKYRGPVDLKPFACTDTPKSSFIRRVCYDDRKRYMLIKLNETWYHYCEIGKVIVTQLLAADSAGRYYNVHLRGGPYDCRMHPVPSY